jgi:Mor family transcriptional regulator
MDKRKDFGILLVCLNMIKYGEEVDVMEKETELYNSVYREICEIVGLDATLKIYLRFKGQQISFPVRLYNPHLIQQNVIKEYDGSNIRELAKKYDYSEKTIRRMIRDSLEDNETEDEEEENLIPIT